MNYSEHKIERRGDYLNIIDTETGDELHVRVLDVFFEAGEYVGNKRDKFIYDAF